MNTLLQTINNPNHAAGTTGYFKGFNFFNFDLRSFSTLNGANTTLQNVKVYLAYDNATKRGTAPLTNANTGVPNTGISLASIANDTNLADFINLNGTTNVNGQGGATKPGCKYQP